MHIPKFLKNKYVIAFLVFIIWTAFLDRNNITNTLRNKNRLHKLMQDKQYYLKDIRETRQLLDELNNNPRSFEKFVRENFYMKRDNEQVIVIEEKK